MIRLCRWGRAEYEGEWITGLPAAVIRTDDPADAEIVVVPSKRRVTAEQVPKARLVITTTSGFDNLDLRGLTDAGILCARLPLARRDAVVQTTLGMIFALTRRFGRYRAGALAGRWERDRLATIDARNLGTVGVIGVGVIGAQVVRALDGLAQVIPCDPQLPGGATLADALAADVVTLHCSLTPATRGFIDPYALRPGAILVNTARGKLMDAHRALDAVRSGHLGGLGLDVFPDEPADLRPFDHPDVIVSPHAAGWHERLGEQIAEGVADAVRAYVDERPIPFRLDPAQQELPG